MTKETVRYADDVVTAVESAVERSAFDSKSEFYRFSAEYVLDRLDEDFEPVTFEYDELIAELDLGTNSGSEGDVTRERRSSDFIEVIARVRQHVYRNELEQAEEAIDAAYVRTDIEAIILEEMLQLYRLGNGH